MFEQDRYLESQRSRGMFRDTGQTGPGMSRYQVSGTGDSAELAADQAADQAVGGLFRSPEGTDVGGFQADLADADLSGGGSPLPEGLMGSMEQSLGASFSGVRLHTDAGADRASRQISARAFTRGQDIYFRSGTYEPDTREGQHLIAHELAHVAAGDTGIHRAGENEGKLNLINTNVGRLATSAGPKNLELQVHGSRAFLTKLNQFIGECGDMDSMAAEIRGGSLGKELVKKRVTESNKLESDVKSSISDLKKGMEDYVTVMSAGASPDLAKNNVNYKEATALLKELEMAQDQLTTKVKPGLQWANETLNRQTGPNETSELPEPVERMLSSSACGQFFKAVADVRKGSAVKGANETVEGLNQTAMAGASTLHGNVAEKGSDKVARRAGNVGTGIGYASFATDMLSGASDLNTEANEDNMSKHDENFRIASGVFSSTTAAASTTASMVGFAAESKSLRDQESERKRKILEMQAKNQAKGVDTGIGKAHSSDHWARVGAAGSGTNVVANAVGFGSSVAGSFKSTNDTAETVNNALGVGASATGALGGTLGMAANSRKAEEARKRDASAKNSMRSIGKRLRATIASPPTTDKDKAIAEICTRLEGKKFNAGKAEDQQLGALITAALGRNDISSEQKKMLGTIKALETSRAASKGTASDLRKDAFKDALGLTGSLTSLAGNIMKMASDSLGVAGTIVGMIGSLIGLGSTIWDTVNAGKEGGAAKQQESRNQERDDKVAACQEAINQMAALPELQLDTLQATRRAKLPLPAPQLAAAEEYAAVFSIIESANVEMTDFLYAVEMGDFGSESDSGEKKKFSDSLSAMYGNLSFTS